MSINLQQLIENILENNAAGVGGVFGSQNAYSPENIDKLDTKFAMAITGTKKKKKTPLIKRNLRRSL